MQDMLVLIAAGTNDGIVRDEPERYHNALTANQVPHIYYATQGINASGQPSSGGHDGDVYKHGLYNFMRRIFHKESAPAQTAAAETAKYILRLNSFWPASIFLKKC